MRTTCLIPGALALLLSTATLGANEPLTTLFDEYRTQGATDFSAKRGAALWNSRFDGRSCTQCHSDDARAGGKHQKTRKPIEPMAPSMNAKRLTDAKQIRKWLKRNCKWTLKRECTAQEKGDVLTWLKQQ